MTREALLQKAREWLTVDRIPESWWHSSPSPAQVWGLLADFCLSQLVAENAEIETLRKALNRQRLKHTAECGCLEEGDDGSPCKWDESLGQIEAALQRGGELIERDPCELRPHSVEREGTEGGKVK